MYHRKPEDITHNGTTLAQILADHALWLQGEGGKRANLTRADLTDANLTRADLTRANMWGAVGNMVEVKSMQVERWTVTYTADTLQIGCQRHPIAAWRDASPEWIAAMDPNAADWWGKFGPIILGIIDASPATPTGHEGGGK